MSFEQKLCTRCQGSKQNGLAKFFEISSQIEGVVALTVGEPDFDTPWHIREEAIHAISSGFTFYSPIRGLLELRKEISAYLKRSFSIQYDPQTEVLVTAGCSEAIDLTMRVFLNPGDEVIIPSPGYVAYQPAVELCDAVVVPVTCTAQNHFKLTPEALEAAITDKTKLLVLNYPSNPTGGIMTYEDYAKIVPIIKKHDLIVLADEIYGELTYSGKHCSIAQFEEIKDNIIYMNGVSKAYAMTGWRIGYICANAVYINAMNRIHENSALASCTISQYAAIEALKNGDRDIEEMKLSFEQRRNYLVNECNRLGLTCHMPQGAFYVYPSIRSTGLDSNTFCTRLVQEQKVAVVPGNAFGDAGEGYIRISYAYSMDKIKEALKRIEAFLHSL